MSLGTRGQICVFSLTYAMWHGQRHWNGYQKGISQDRRQENATWLFTKRKIASVWDAKVQGSYYARWLSLIILCTWNMLRELDFKFLT